MKCPYCNQEIADGSVTCPLCGRELTGAQPADPAAAPEVMDSAQQPAGAPEAADSAQQQPAAGPETPDQAVVTAAGMETPGAGQQASPAGKKKWVLPAAAAAVVAVGVGAYTMMSAKDPKDVVVDAFKSITAEGQTDPAEEIFGLSAMMEKINTSPSEIRLELALEDTSIADLSALATGSFNMEVWNDPGNQQMRMDMGIGYGGMDLATLAFYLDDVQMAAAIPELSTKVFTLNYTEDLEGQLEKSPYLGAILKESGTDLNGFAEYMAQCSEMASSGEQLFDIEALWNRYKEGSQAIDDLKEAMTVEKAQARDYTIDGETVSCKGYEVQLTKDALIQFVNTSKDFFLTDETLKSDFIEYMSLAMKLENSMTEMTGVDVLQTPEELQAETWEEAETAINDLIAQLDSTMGDLALTVWVQKDGRMAGFEYETTAAVDGESVRLFGEAYFQGGYSMLANCGVSLNIEDPSGQVVTLGLDKTGEYEPESVWTNGLVGTLASGDEVYSFDYSDSYQIADGTYELTLDFLSSDVSQLLITSSGAFSDVVKGESMALTMDSIRVESEPLFGAGNYLDLSCIYAVGPLEGTVEMPEGEPLDILAASEADYDAVLTEMTGNLFGLMMNLY